MKNLSVFQEELKSKPIKCKDYLYNQYKEFKSMYFKQNKFLQSLVIVVAITTIGLVFFNLLNLLNTAMLFMIPILFSAFYNSRKEVFIISLLSVLSFDILFIPPRFSLTVSDVNYLLSFSIMIATGQIVAYLAKQASIAKELEMSNKIQDTLLESLSHELRTPLAVIKGYSSSLLEQDLVLTEKERLEFIQNIDENAEDMDCLINNLLSSAKLKNGILHIKKEVCDIEEIIGSVLIKTDKNELVNFTMTHNLPTVFGNAIFIEQALVNLLDNALKYGHEVSITALQVSHGIIIVVKNKGNVPSSYEISNATKPFIRLSNASSKRGLGLGLHVVQLITDIHKGTLSLKSQNGEFIAQLFLPKSGL